MKAVRVLFKIVKSENADMVRFTVDRSAGHPSSMPFKVCNVRQVQRLWLPTP